MCDMADIERDAETNPTERVVVPVTSNAKLECSQFCLDSCGIYADAQDMAMLGSMMVAPGVISVNFSEENPTIHSDSDVELPQLLMACKGPRKKHWVVGELVFRKKAKIDTV